MTDDLKIVMVPRDLYYHEVAYVRGLENERVQLQHLLKAAAYHVESEGDISLLTMIRAALEPKP